MPADTLLGIIAFAAVGGAIYLFRPSRLRHRAVEKARKAVATAAPLAEATARDYLRASQVQQWLDQHRSSRRLALTRRARRRLKHDPELSAAYDLVAALFERPWRWTAERNEAFVHARLDQLDDWFTTRLPYPLTDEQRRAVVTDEDNNLVVAGAGSGKTSVIVGKLAYLMEQRDVPASDILVLAFNTTVAAELKERIEALGMPLPEDPSGDALEGLLASVEDSFPPFVGLLSSFLELFRAGGWTRTEVQKRAESRRDREFLELFWPLLDDYEEALRLEGKIDFSEMLLGASKAMDGGFEPPAYRYILVDEFQDVSRARLELIRGLRGDAGTCRLFLVGDDWQSIYRFAGSDVSCFTAAPEYLGATARTDLGRTFRLTPDVAALSSHFITRNPAQLDKQIIPRDVDLGRPSVVIRLYDVSEAHGLQEVLEEISRTEAGPVRVLVLGRYNHTFRVLDEFPLGVPENVQLQPLTVHRSKGLEADHVIVLGLGTGRYGFPSEMEDDSVLRLLLANEEAFPNAEERRLFYVALTRSRSRVYLFAPATDPSSFVQELLGEDYATWIGSSKEWSAGYRCPRCRGRTIRRKEGVSGSFWGCSNYPACYGVLPVCFECGSGILEPRTGARGVLLGYTCSECRREAELCPECGVGALIPRDGPHGVFMGCSEWRWDGKGCGYTRALSAAGQAP